MMDDSKMKEAQAFLHEDKDEGACYLCDCPHCGELVDLSDDFRWRNGRYEMTSVCGSCYGDEFLVTRGADT